MPELIADALWPPADPGQLVHDLVSVGAQGAMVYVWRSGGVGSWTPYHVTVLRQNGMRAAPIIVPPPGSGGDIGSMIASAQMFGFMGGPITLDLEFPNLPDPAWEEQFDAYAQSKGFWDFDYGTQTTLGNYLPDSSDWIASWIRTGQLDPLPVKSSQQSGWQFVNDVVVGGSMYDFSLIDSAVFQPGFTPPVVGGSVGGGDMAACPGNGPKDQFAYGVERQSGNVLEWFSNNGSEGLISGASGQFGGQEFGKPGAGAVPHSISCFNQGGYINILCQDTTGQWFSKVKAPDGSLVHDWTPCAPMNSDPGLPGPAPAAGFVRHTHGLSLSSSGSTDGGTPS